VDNKRNILNERLGSVLMKNIPTELLRTYVTVVELGGFTQAAELLGRTSLPLAYK
jgi:hypothetical protein